MSGELKLVVLFGLGSVALSCAGGGQTVEVDQVSAPDLPGSVDLATDVPVAPEQRGEETAPADVLWEAEAGPVGCAPGDGCFGDNCALNSDCQSGWCVDHLGDGVCSQLCQDECPAGWACKLLAGTEPDMVWLCVSNYSNLC